MMLILRLFLIFTAMTLINSPWAYVVGGALIMVSFVWAFMRGMSP